MDEKEMNDLEYDLIARTSKYAFMRLVCYLDQQKKEPQPDYTNSKKSSATLL